MFAPRPPPPPARPLRFRTEGGVEEIKVAGHFCSGSGDVLHAWALEGRGLSLEALWNVAEDLQAGRLAECLADYWCDSIDLFAAFLPGRPDAAAHPAVRGFHRLGTPELKSRALPIGEAAIVCPRKQPWQQGFDGPGFPLAPNDKTACDSASLCKR
jgi:hypothetical protein